MNKSKLLAIILTLIFSANLTASGAYEAVDYDNDLKVIHEKTFNIEPGKRLKLSGSSGDIMVTSWDRSEVYIKILGNDKAKEKVDFIFDAGKDLIEVTAKREGYFLSSSGISLRFEVKVPSRFHTHLNTSGGDIRFAGVEGNNVLNTSGGDINVKETKGDLKVTTSGGDITFEKVAGNFSGTTSGGDIKGREFSGDIAASTSGGDITLDGQNSKLSAKTSGGDIVLKYSGDNKGIELATSGGDINITVPENFNASALLNTSGGDISFNIKTSNVKKLSSSRFEGDINNGGGKLVAKTSGGTIRVNSR
jgi:DUF4097 and DUF4098 domain-containing protein YvlB